MNMPVNQEPQSSHDGLLKKGREYRRELAGIVLGLVVTLLAFYAKDERGFVACLILGPTITLTSLTLLPRTSFLGVRTPGRYRSKFRVKFALLLWVCVVAIILGLLFKVGLLSAHIAPRVR